MANSARRRKAQSSQRLLPPREERQQETCQAYAEKSWRERVPEDRTAVTAVKCRTGQLTSAELSMPARREMH